MEQGGIPVKPVLYEDGSLPGRTARLARMACIALLALLALMFLWVAGNRLLFPYNVEWLEGTLFADSLRIWQGLPLYVDPESGWVSLGYNPFYQYFVALFIPLVGPSVCIGRAVSLASTLLSAAIICGVSRKATGNRTAGLFGAALFIASFPVTGFWYDLARVDSLWILTMLMGCAVAAGGSATFPRLALSAALFAVSFLTKQHALVAAGCVFLYLCVKSPRRALLFAALAGIFVGAGVLLLQWRSGGWYWHYVFEMQGGTLKRGMLPNFFHPARADIHMGILFYLLQYYPICYAAIALLVACRALGVRGRAPEGLWVLLLAAFLAVDAVNYAKTRAWHNSFYPTVAFTSVLVGLLAGRITKARASHPVVALCFHLLLLGQLGLLLYDPADHIPTGGDRAAGDEFIRYVSGMEGEVWVPHHPDYAYRAGKGLHYTAEGSERYYKLTGTLINRLIDDVKARRYRYIIVDAPLDAGFSAVYPIPELRDALKAHYAQERLLEYGGVRFKRRLDYRQDWDYAFQDDQDAARVREVFMPVDGSKFRPCAVLVPLGGSAVKGRGRRTRAATDGNVARGPGATGGGEGP